jgi:hypothetical protein
MIVNAMEAAKGGPVLAAVISCQLQLLEVCTQTSITILNSSLALRAPQYTNAVFLQS